MVLGAATAGGGLLAMRKVQENKKKKKQSGENKVFSILKSKMGNTPAQQSPSPNAAAAQNFPNYGAQQPSPHSMAPGSGFRMAQSQSLPKVDIKQKMAARTGANQHNCKALNPSVAQCSHGLFVNAQVLLALISDITQQAGRAITISPQYAQELISKNAGGLAYLDCLAAKALLSSLKNPLLAFVKGDADGSNAISAREFDAISHTVAIPLGINFFDVLIRSHYANQPQQFTELGIDDFVRYMVNLLKLDAQMQLATNFNPDYSAIWNAPPQILQMLALAIISMSM